jgi:hypothetical protein
MKISLLLLIHSGYFSLTDQNRRMEAGVGTASAVNLNVVPVAAGTRTFYANVVGETSNATGAVTCWYPYFTGIFIPMKY